MPTKMNVIITKYATTSGVFVKPVIDCFDISKDMVAEDNEAGNYSVCYHKPHWHTDKESALHQVFKMLDAKKRSLEKALKKLSEKREEAIRVINNAEL